MNSTAVIDYPPQTVQFAQILDKHRAGSRHECIPVIINMSRDPHDELAPSPPDFHQYPPYARRYSGDSHLGREPSSRLDIAESLKAVGYGPADWVSQGLDDYFKWLDAQFESSNFQKSLSAVRRQDIGLHSFGMDGINAEFLMTQCGILAGHALRILNNFGRWLDEKPLDVRNG